MRGQHEALAVPVAGRADHLRPEGVFQQDQVGPGHDLIHVRAKGGVARRRQMEQGVELLAVAGAERLQGRARQLEPEPALRPHQQGVGLELDLDAPCFTAFSDDTDAVNIARAIQHEPARLARQAPVLDLPGSLELVSRRMVAAQIAVERLLKTQFGP